MKTLNQYRKTNQVNITGTELNQMLAVQKFLTREGLKLIGIASIDLHNYCVRVDATVAVYDFLINVTGADRVTIMDKALIFKMSTVV